MFVDGVWVVSRYADVVAVICDTPRFSNQAGISVRRFDPTLAECGGKPTMMSMDGIKHRNNRTVTHRLFSRGRSILSRRSSEPSPRCWSSARSTGGRRFHRRYRLLHAAACGLRTAGNPGRRPGTSAGLDQLDHGAARSAFHPVAGGVRTGTRGALALRAAIYRSRRGTEPDEGVMTAIARGSAGVLSDDEVSGYMLAARGGRQRNHP